MTSKARRVGVFGAFLACGTMAQPAPQVDECALPALTQEDPAFAAELAATVRESSQRLRSVASADGAGSDEVEFYKRMFLALRLGSVADEDSALVFNFSPERLGLARLGVGSLRATVRDARVFESLSAAIEVAAAEAGAAAVDRLEQNLGDLDDVEVSVRWAFGRRDAGESQEGTFELFRSITEGTRAIGQSLLTSDSSAAEALSESTQVRGRITDRCREAARLSDQNRLEAWAALLGVKGQDLRTAAIDSAIGQPTTVLDVSRRERAPEAGPSSTTVRLLFSVGGQSTRGLNRIHQSLEARERNSVEAANRYFERHRLLRGGLLQVSASYTEVEGYDYRLTDPAVELVLPKSKVLSAKLSLGERLDSDFETRLNLEAAYENATGDSERNDRLMASLILTRRLSKDLAFLAGGSNLTLSLVYANRPEYRGEVDRELSLRAGLKWSVGDSE